MQTQSVHDEHELVLTHFQGMRRHDVIAEIIKTQNALWLISQALNLPMEDRLTLDKGWTSRSLSQLVHTGALVSLEHRKREAELQQMETTYGKADEIRKEIEGLNRTYLRLCEELKMYPARLFPKGFRYMNSFELQSVRKNAMEQVAYAQARVAEQLEKIEQRKREDAQAATRRAERAVLEAQLDAKRNKRKAELEGVYAEYDATLKRLKDHPVLGNFRAATPRFTTDHRDQQAFVLADEASFEARVRQAQAQCANAIRSLREPLRRAWQSAYDRRTVRVDFKEYLEQEGFGHLFVK